jgi:hypothetical protein
MLSGVVLLITAIVLLLSEDENGTLANIALYFLFAVTILLILSVIFGYLAAVKNSNRMLGIVSTVISFIVLVLCSVFMYYAASAIMAFT